MPEWSHKEHHSFYSILNLLVGRSEALVYDRTPSLGWLTLVYSVAAPNPFVLKIAVCSQLLRDVPEPERMSFVAVQSPV
jgi:hypothetical protein